MMAEDNTSPEAANARYALFYVTNLMLFFIVPRPKLDELQ